tara:strand:+ start:338 stop:493 length:156 start_codon:yes stop_codon:yes gene_type:complete
MGIDGVSTVPVANIYRSAAPRSSNGALPTHTTPVACVGCIYEDEAISSSVC